MRTDQYIGLNDRTEEWIDAHAEQETTETLQISYVNGVEIRRGRTSVIGPTKYDYSYIEGAYNDVVEPLYRYKLLDGREVEEYVQETRWSSGPMYFVAIAYAGMPPCNPECVCLPSLAELAWTDAEIAGEP